MPSRKVPAGPCGTCDAVFEAYPWQLAKGWGKYCSQSCGTASRTQARNAAWQGEGVKYEAAHYRVRAAKGVASGHACACGEAANEWAYTHNDPNELTCPKGRPYSADVSYYVPMCRPCHRRSDSARKRLAHAV